MSAVRLIFNLILTCLVHLHIFHILETSPVLKFFPEHITSSVMTSNINTISPFKILIPNSRLVHSTLLLPTAVPSLHISRPLMQTVCHLEQILNCMSSIRYLVVVYPYLCNKTKKVYLRATVNIRQVSHMM
jgi:hypothetical protein